MVFIVLDKDVWIYKALLVRVRGRMNWALLFSSFCVLGYCGADIKALCTEAALIALRRRYPQIYASSHKLQLDVSSIVLSAQDFYHAMQNIVPASQRAVMSSGHALSPIIRPLLERSFNNILAVLQKVFPHAEISQSDKKEGTINYFFVLLNWNKYRHG